jgi:hypothetical protein
MDPVLDAARSGIGTVLVAHADVAEQSCEQGAMDRAVAFGLLRAHRGLRTVERFLQLLVHIAPFAQARIGKKILPA